MGERFDVDDVVEKALERAREVGCSPQAAAAPQLLAELCPLIDDSPPAVQETYAIAEAHWLHGVGDEFDMEKARHRHWAWIEQRQVAAGSSWSQFLDADHRVARAVICLFANRDENEVFFYDGIDFFNLCLTQPPDHSDVHELSRRREKRDGQSLNA